MPGYPTPIDDMVIAATNQLPQFPYTEDMNKGSEIGLGAFHFSSCPNKKVADIDPHDIGWTFSSAGYGLRSSAATAYLTPDVYARKNLDVLIQHQVLKLVSNDSTADSPSFATVQFAASADSE